MRLVEFNGPKFADHISAKTRCRCTKNAAMRATGVSAGMMNRLSEQGHAPKDISSILSLCAYFKLSIKDYIVL